MGWWIECRDREAGCDGEWATNIRDLVESHRDEQGRFSCSCGNQGFIRKSYSLQEEGEKWEPLLFGALLFDENASDDETYFPFVFLVSYEEDDWSVYDLWFSYFKDTRHTDENGQRKGRLKMGHGPGGPPVVNVKQLPLLLSRLESTFASSNER